MKRASLILLLLAGACAPKPVLYPNEKFKATEQEQVQADIDDCRAQAKKFVKTHKSQIVAARTGAGAAFGALMGLIAGAFTGNYTRAVAEGAALGGGAGAVHGGAQAATPDAVHRRFVDICLTDRGYQPIGWK
jgi:outer membrane lipoprotein SlyB